MPDLILRPSGLPKEKGLPWALQLRYHDCCGPAEYYTVTNVSEEMAREIMRAGAPFWLYGDPDEPRRGRIEEAVAQAAKRAAPQAEFLRLAAARLNRRRWVAPEITEQR